MRHKNSVFHALMQYVPWGYFEQLVDENGGDKGVRKLTSRDHFGSVLYGQLSGASSLREIEGALHSHRARLYHVNVKPVKRSTLADANASRPAAIFTGLFLRLMKQTHRGLRRSLEETVYLRFNEPSPDRVEQGVGALFVWRLRREGARHLRRGCGLPRLHGGERRQCERHFGRPSDAH